MGGLVGGATPRGGGPVPCHWYGGLLTRISSYCVAAWYCCLGLSTGRMATGALGTAGGGVLYICGGTAGLRMGGGGRCVG